MLIRHPPAHYSDEAGLSVALVIAALVWLGPLLRWRGDGAQAVLERLMGPIAATAFTAAGLFVFARGIGTLPFVGLSLAAGLLVASVMPLVARAPLRISLPVYGMVAARLGLALGLAGLASVAAFTDERIVSAHAGETVRIGPHVVTFAGMTPRIGDGWSALEANLSIARGEQTDKLRPQTRYFARPATSASESATLTSLDGRFDAVLGSPDGQGRWQLRLSWRPFMTLICLGGALIVLGGVLSLAGQPRRERRRLAPPLAAALVLGAAAYALQFTISWPLSAPPSTLAAEPDDPEMTALRDDLLGRYTLDAAYLTAADAMTRVGERRAAVRVLLGGINRLPRSFALWTALGTAYAAHDGRVSPAARFAFDQAARLASKHPAPPFFLGLAYVRSGKHATARPLWARAVALSPREADYRRQIASRLTSLDSLLEANGKAETP